MKISLHIYISVIYLPSLTLAVIIQSLCSMNYQKISEQLSNSMELIKYTHIFETFKRQKQMNPKDPQLIQFLP